MRDPDYTITPKRPIVYAWRDKAGTVIYVGMSGVGLVRPLTRDHIAYNKGHSLSVWNCKSREGAHKLEIKLIQELNPELNTKQYYPWVQPEPFGGNLNIEPVSTLSPAVEQRLGPAIRWKPEKPEA